MTLAFGRLGPDAIPEILGLLGRSWPKHYGATGHPDFSAGMLGWHYGGPDGGRHLLLGARRGGDLVGFKAFLYRRVRWGDRLHGAHVATHLAIDPDLPMGERMAAAGELSRLHALEEPENAGFGGPADLSLAFFESTKALSRNATAISRRHGFHVGTTRFRQAIVHPRKLSAFLETGHPVPVRDAGAADWGPIADRLDADPPEGPAWHPSAADIAHFAAAAPEAKVWAALAPGGAAGLSGCLLGYTLGWRRGGALTRMFIVEAVSACGSASLGALLQRAVGHAAAAGLRGVVLENAGFLPQPVRKELGILPAPREMVLMIRSRNPLPEEIGAFRLDVK